MHFPIIYWIKQQYQYISWCLWVKSLRCAWGRWQRCKFEWLELEQGAGQASLFMQSMWSLHMAYFGLPQTLAASGLVDNFHDDLGSSKQGGGCSTFSKPNHKRYAVSLLPHSIGTRVSQACLDSKGWEHRPLFSIGEWSRVTLQICFYDRGHCYRHCGKYIMPQSALSSKLYLSHRHTHTPLSRTLSSTPLFYGKSLRLKV